MSEQDNINNRDDKMAANELDEFMEEIGDGAVTVKVTRLDPPMGYCGEFHITKSNPLSLKELKRRFGGRVFQLNSRSSNGRIRKQKTVSIDDVPRREGFEILPDGSTASPHDQQNKKDDDREHPLAVFAKMGLPPHLMEQLTPWAMGYAVPPQKENKPDQDYELMRQQNMMNMMNAQLQMQMDFQREMMQLKKDLQTENHPRNPYSDMEMIFRMMREMKGFQTEMGGGENSLATEALQGTMSLVENGLSEFLSLKKLQAQSEIAKGSFMQESKRELPQRTASPAMLPRVATEGDPVALARQMGEMFKSLDPTTQQQALSAFFGETPDNSENIENMPYSDTIENEPDILDAEDQELLNSGADTDQIEAGHVSNGEHPAPADDNHQADRAGYTPGQSELSD